MSSALQLAVAFGHALARNCICWQFKNLKITRKKNKYWGEKTIQINFFRFLGYTKTSCVSKYYKERKKTMKLILIVLILS